MITTQQDPDKYSWDGLYSWSEPGMGSRLEWKNDPWRYWKLALVPIVLCGAAAYRNVPVTPRSVALLSAVSAAAIIYVWLWSFAARSIRLFEDKLTIGRAGSHAGACGSIYYSEIQKIDVHPCDAHFRISLKLKTGKDETLFSFNKEGAERLFELYKQSSMVKPQVREPLESCPKMSQQEGPRV